MSSAAQMAALILAHWPDGDDLTKVQLIVVDLSDENGRHGLVECSSVHVDGGTDRKHKAYDSPVDVVVLQEALKGDGQRGWAEEKSEVDKEQH